MAPSTCTARHTDAQIVAVAEGLTLVAGTEGAAEQLRRIYGEQRVTDALAPLVGATRVEAPVVGERTGAVLTLAHPRHTRISRAYGPTPRTGRVQWL